ncbi:hypothetical protein [Kitasatospora sp. KL5]|uniref:hypothetical protein n=1 Tax=Kitasatospora sp. KL5 TaxID=3425125 RepID=UPI003D6FF166
MLAAARKAVLVPTVPPLFLPLRREMDRQGSVEARMCFYLSGLFTAVDEIQRHLSAGVPVVVESYFARCLSNHRAFGARLGIELPPDLPKPAAYHLICAEKERRRRLAQRDKPLSRWDVLGEEVSDEITNAYEQFPMRHVNTTGLGPEQVVDTILALNSQG